jgi:hypothetical protein
VPPWIDAAVQRALAKRPDDRFPGAKAFIAALAEPHPDAASSAPPRPMPTSGIRPARSSRTVSARTAVYAAAIMLVVGIATGLVIGRGSLVRSILDPGPASPRFSTDATPPAAPGQLALSVLDRSGRSLREIGADRPWTPRFSPDGRRVAYGAFGSGRRTSDLWVTDLAAGTTQRITDDDADANDPQWSPDGATLAYSAGSPGGKDLFARSPGGTAARIISSRDGSQFPSDWLRDGSALLVTEETGTNGHDILVQPALGSGPRPYAATAADETAARISPDGSWVAYTSDASGRPEVYIDSYLHPGRPVRISLDGGVHPVWRGDGRELFYWRDGTLVAVQLAPSALGAPPVPVTRADLFRAAYDVGVNTMYDVSPDGQRFVMVRRP